MKHPVSNHGFKIRNEVGIANKEQREQKANLRILSKEVDPVVRRMYEKFYKLGIKEVVEWVNDNGIWAQVYFAIKEEERTMLCLFPDEWQAFKKSKGVNNDRDSRSC